MNAPSSPVPIELPSPPVCNSVFRILNCLCGRGLPIVLLLGIWAGCRPVDRPTPTPAVTSTVTPTPTLIPSPTPTPLPRELTICMAEEPNTLFLYGGPSRAARNVLEALYDGPIDTPTYRFRPGILEKLPSLADGDAVLRPVRVAEGSRVVDASGRVLALRPGVTVRDATGKPLEYTGGTITMTQMVVTFTLRAGLLWSDGTPLTAADSVYSFELAGAYLDNLPLRLRMLYEQTESYVAADERTVVWTSLPGYHDLLRFHAFYFQNFYFENFYSPLPRHVWGTSNPEWLATAEVAQEKPIGWGAFVIQEWVKGDHLTLVANPNYFRSAEGLPYLERVTFRFVPDLEYGLNQLLDGTCDLLTQDVLEREALRQGSLHGILEAADLGQVQLIFAPSNEWEHLDFNVNPPDYADRPPFFADVRTRRAVAMCIHRARIAGEALPYSAASLTDSYIPSDHPLYAGEGLQRYEYDPIAAMTLLEEVGWRDEDRDGIREAHGVREIADGTPFSVTLVTNSDHLAHQRTARILAENLAACGIKLTVEFLPGDKLFADGPDGPVFGRKFDLTLFSWLNDLDPPCWLYLSSEIPSAENWWATSNNPGYSNPEYDAACRAAMAAWPGTDEYVRFHKEAQRILSRDVPVLPLYVVPKLIVARPGVGGVVLDPTEYLELWNIEAFTIGLSSGS